HPPDAQRARKRKPIPNGNHHKTNADLANHPEVVNRPMEGTRRHGPVEIPPKQDPKNSRRPGKPRKATPDQGGEDPEGEIAKEDRIGGHRPARPVGSSSRNIVD